MGHRVFAGRQKGRKVGIWKVGIYVPNEREGRRNI